MVSSQLVASTLGSTFNKADIVADLRRLSMVRETLQRGLCSETSWMDMSTEVGLWRLDIFSKLHNLQVGCPVCMACQRASLWCRIAIILQPFLCKSTSGQRFRAVVNNVRQSLMFSHDHHKGRIGAFSPCSVGLVGGLWGHCCLRPSRDRRSTSAKSMKRGGCDWPSTPSSDT